MSRHWMRARRWRSDRRGRGRCRVDVWDASHRTLAVVHVSLPLERRGGGWRVVPGEFWRYMAAVRVLYPRMAGGRVVAAP